jgi:hypothetical protein
MDAAATGQCGGFHSSPFLEHRMSDQVLTPGIWFSDLGTLAWCYGDGGACALDAEGYVGEFDPDEEFDERLGTEWRPMVPQGKKYLVTLAARMDDLPVKLFDDKQKAIDFANEIWNGGEQRVLDVLRVARNVLGRDTSTVITFNVIEIDEDGVPIGIIHATGHGAEEYEF